MTTSTGMKKGRISKNEEKYIQENLHHMDARAIALALNRDPESVEDFIKRKFKVGATDEELATFDLEDRPYWKELKLQFTADELELFKYHWGRIIGQFKDNVIPTEELQVIDLIKLELLMNRCLKLNKSSTDDILMMEELVREQRGLDGGLQNRDEIFNLERQISSLKASQESLTKDYRELQTKKNAMLKEMRATREQRVKDIEESTKSFTGWITQLINEPEVCRGYGLEMEKMRLAMEKERKRLSAYHTYEDGQIDRPFLVPEGPSDDD